MSGAPGRLKPSSHRGAQHEGTPENIDCLRPGWPAPSAVRALCTTRRGGHSGPPYESLNLGDHVGDDPQAVAENRVTLRRAMPARPVFLSQVHGADVIRLTDQTPDGERFDACFTTQTGVACTVMVADCLPVLMCNRQGSWVAAAHAGWRGLAGHGGAGVLEALLRRLLALAGPQGMVSQTSDVLVWLGPCIGPSAFEVGSEVRAAFVAALPEAAECFVASGQGKWLADLAALARQRLVHLGLPQVDGNDSSAAWCTAGNPDKFFSHRRDRVSGRMAACIWLEATSQTGQTWSS
ncbi:MAG: peptidoglycan editing factor PgeF [Rhodoferax sp.]|nr:peptidoglycan editing factor PgeF [Rhodoferax sp.]